MSHPCCLLSFSPILFPATSPEHVLFGPSLLDRSLVSMSRCHLPTESRVTFTSEPCRSFSPTSFPPSAPSKPRLPQAAHAQIFNDSPEHVASGFSSHLADTLLLLLLPQNELTTWAPLCCSPGPWPSSSSPCPHLTTVTARVTLCYQCLMDGSFPGDWAA